MQFTLPNRKIIWQLALASGISMAVYLAASELYFRVGFPLDDSWIHLTYARNLAVHGEWAFEPGKPLSGVNCPSLDGVSIDWISAKLAPYIWTYLLGAILLLGMGLLGEMVVRRVSPAYQSLFPWVGLFLILEWHMVWSAASGMETLLHALLVTTVLGMLIGGSRRFLTLGLLAGLSVWVRPDGITLLGPIAVYALAGQAPAQSQGAVSGVKSLRDISQVLIGFASLFVPYLLFNLVLDGTPMPNTFYAKQAEYVDWQARPFLSRFGDLSLQFLAGPSLALLPGAIGLVCAICVETKLGHVSWNGLVCWLSVFVCSTLARLPARALYYASYANLLFMGTGSTYGVFEDEYIWTLSMVCHQSLEFLRWGDVLYVLVGWSIYIRTGCSSDRERDGCNREVGG
jgi:hypothetical protein